MAAPRVPDEDEGRHGHRGQGDAAAMAPSSAAWKPLEALARPSEAAPASHVRVIPWAVSLRLGPPASRPAYSRPKVQADQMRARAKNNMTKRLSPLGHKVEGKQARVEARQNWRALRLARQVKRIRKTDRMPSRFRCYNWFLC
ncbi:hypothetical protein VPH35_076822 [Triticum aestivum]|uniref:Remorin C-terminal domain-containing protein n=1 Tax=Aegilops tauschii TaxID=37682 RepID=M8BGI0_AEGTA